MLPRSYTCEDILEMQLMMAKLGRNIFCHLSIKFYIIIIISIVTKKLKMKPTQILFSQR
jgi:hypothetical protein